MELVLKTEMPDIGTPRRGKVRDIYDLGEHLLLVVTDRLSAFDVVLPDGIPNKGRILTAISVFWFRQMEEIVRNHIVATDVRDFPKNLQKYSEMLEGRSLLVKKAKVVPIECIVRGYLSGSGWQSYKKDGTVCGIALPRGLKESGKLPQPIFTPSTKAEEGHDENISFGEVVMSMGEEAASKLRELSLRVYGRAREIAEHKGIIVADTKFEFGTHNGQLILIDEILTPDSSRFWSASGYKPGRAQDSYDKQIVRDYLLTLDWNKQYPGPELPPEIIEKTARRYQEILNILTS